GIKKRLLYERCQRQTTDSGRIRRFANSPACAVCPAFIRRKPELARRESSRSRDQGGSNDAQALARAVLRLALLDTGWTSGRGRHRFGGRFSSRIQRLSAAGSYAGPPERAGERRLCPAELTRGDVELDSDEPQLPGVAGRSAPFDRRAAC